MQRNYKILPVVSLCAAVLLLIVWNLFWNNDYNIEIRSYGSISYKSESIVGDDRLFNLSFNYALKSNLCGNTSRQIFAVFIVTSYFGNVETRNSLRRAFSNMDLEKINLRRVFLLGYEANVGVSQDMVENESKQFGDIIQGNFKEAYRNLTYKHVMGLKWISQYCANVDFVIKMDDDTVVDVRRLIKLLHKIHLPSQNYIIGYTMTRSQPVRDPKSKWYISKEEFQHDTYPTFVSGWLYATTPQVALLLSTIANKEKYFWIDDVFVTGILAQKLNIRYLRLNQYFATEAKPIKCCLRELIFPCNYLIGPNEGEVDMFYNFNALTSKCLYGKVCSKHNIYANKKCSEEERATFSDGSLVKSVRSAKAIIVPFRFGNISPKL